MEEAVLKALGLLVDRLPNWAVVGGFFAFLAVVAAAVSRRLTASSSDLSTVAKALDRRLLDAIDERNDLRRQVVSLTRQLLRRSGVSDQPTLDAIAPEVEGEAQGRRK